MADEQKPTTKVRYASVISRSDVSEAAEIVEETAAWLLISIVTRYCVKV